MRQRVPYQSKETLDKPEEYARLADALTDFFTVLSVCVRIAIFVVLFRPDFFFADR